MMRPDVTQPQHQIIMLGWEILGPTKLKPKETTKRRLIGGISPTVTDKS